MGAVDCAVESPPRPAGPRAHSPARSGELVSRTAHRHGGDACAPPGTAAPQAATDENTLGEVMQLVAPSLSDPKGPRSAHMTCDPENTVWAPGERGTWM